MDSAEDLGRAMDGYANVAAIHWRAVARVRQQHVRAQPVLSVAATGKRQWSSAARPSYGAIQLLGKVTDAGHVRKHVPPGSTVTHVGGALGRPETGIRLCQHPAGSIEEFLKTVSWSGTLAGAGADIAGMLDFADGAVAVITVADAVGERLGLELYCRGEDAARRQDVMIAELTERGWCEPGFVDAIRKWRGA